MKFRLISEQDLAALLGYLESRPMREVEGAVHALRNLPEAPMPKLEAVENDEAA